MTNRDAGGRPAREAAARTAYRWVILCGFLLMLAANLPGHLSYDSVVQLHEGRTGVRATWAPAISSWLLGRFDAVIPGTSLYVAASGLLLAASLLSLKDLRQRTAWSGPVVGLALVVTPTVLIYQAIVWKDVLFANLVIAGFVCLAHAAKRWSAPRVRLWPLAVALLCLSLAILVRQNGLVATLVGAGVLAWTARGGGWRSSAVWGVGGLAAAVVLSLAIGAAVQPRGSTVQGDNNKGVRVLEHYDIVGALAHDPSLKLGVIRSADPSALVQVVGRGVKVYSPERVDTFAQAPGFLKSLWRLPDGVVAAQWREVAFDHTGAYLAHRADVFRWVFLTPRLDRCLPLYVGVDGPRDKLAELGILPVMDRQDQAMAAYAARFYGTPLYNHLTYAILALAVIAALLRRRDPADMAVAGLMLAALGFAGSFFFISVACDYRYLYVLDLAALTGLLYLALDPPIGGSRRRAPPT